MGRKPTAISLYSGAGGLDYGFHAAGFSTVVALEMDRDSCQTMRQNGFRKVVEADIHSVAPASILQAAGMGPGQADVLIGGPPCQPFSKSGYWARGDSGRLEDPRASTLRAFMDVLEHAQPRAFLLENVGGMTFAKKKEGVAALHATLDQINRRGRTSYSAVSGVLRAADFGVPQLRDRFFLIGSRDGIEFSFPSPTHFDPSRHQLPLGDLKPYHTAWDAIGGLDAPPEEDLAIRGKWADLLPSIPEGENYLWHTERRDGGNLFGWRRRYWSFLLKLAKNRPSWTVQAQPGPATGPFHWKNRRLSMRELCRIQTFPDEVRICGGQNSVQRQVGNAVPSLLAEVLARCIRNQLLGLRVSQSPTLMPEDRGPPPEPETPRAIPKKYLHLEGSHEPHPGTGKGYRASAQWGAPSA